MAREAPRSLLPSVVPEFARLRNRVEGPHLLSGVRVEGADVAGRIVAVHEAIAHAVAENHQVLVDNRGRRVGVMLLLDLPDQPAAQIDAALRAEGFDRDARRRVETDQAIAAVDEDPQLV